MLCISSLVKVSPRNAARIEINSSHRKSAQLSVIEDVGNPSCLTILKT